LNYSTPATRAKLHLEDEVDGEVQRVHGEVEIDPNSQVLDLRHRELEVVPDDC
jgi:hypothetical protein